MERPISTVAIYLLAGMKVKIKAPVNPERAQGWFPKTGSQKCGPAGTVQALQNGFCVEDVVVGEITEVKDDELAIVYHHKRAEKNSIWFYAITGEIGICNIVSVPIHDHSSIVQGGPAYGTYFSDDAPVT